MRIALLALTLAATLAAPGCCSGWPARYWQATDLGSGRVFYTADTGAAPLSMQRGPMFISSEGSLVGLASYELKAIDQATFESATGCTVGVSMYPNVGCKATIHMPRK